MASEKPHFDVVLTLRMLYTETISEDPKIRTAEELMNPICKVQVG